MNLPNWWWPLLGVALLLGAGVAVVAPANLTVLMYKVLLLVIATLAASLVDRLAFRTNARKDEANANVARALVFLGVVLGLTLGV